MQDAREKTAKAGDVEIRITKDDAPTVFHDFVLESRQMNGIVYLTLGSVSVDSANPPEVHIVSRHRMSIIAAQGLRDILANLIDDALKPADISKAH